MIYEVLILGISLLLLVKGSERFIKSSASIAKKFNVSEFVIGLTLVAIGTSLPELISSIVASSKGEGSLVVGTLMGANIANLTLIIGVVSIMMVIKTNREMLERDGYIMIASFLLIFLFALDSSITRIEGFFLIVVFVAYTMFLFESKPKGSGMYNFDKFIPYFIKFRYLYSLKEKILGRHAAKKKEKSSSKKGLPKDILLVVVSGLVVFFSANIMVEQALFFAKLFNFPSTIIGILIAIGTTAPEMSVAIAAARKKLGNIVIGNAIGSCLTNGLLILGISSIINPLHLLPISLTYIIPFMIIIGLLLILFIKSNWKITKKEGLFLLALYLVFLFLLISGYLY